MMLGSARVLRVTNLVSLRTLDTSALRISLHARARGRLLPAAAGGGQYDPQRHIRRMSQMMPDPQGSDNLLAPDYNYSTGGSSLGSWNYDDAQLQASYDSLLAEEGDEDNDHEDFRDFRVDEAIYPENPEFALTWNGAQENPMYAVEDTWNLDPNLMLTTNHAQNNMVGWDAQDHALHDFNAERQLKQGMALHFHHMETQDKFVTINRAADLLTTFEQTDVKYFGQGTHQDCPNWIRTHFELEDQYIEEQTAKRPTPYYHTPQGKEDVRLATHTEPLLPGIGMDDDFRDIIQEGREGPYPDSIYDEEIPGETFADFCARTPESIVDYELDEIRELEPGRTYEDYEDGEDIRFRGPRLTKRALLDTVLERDLDEVQGDSYGRVGSLDDIDPATLYLASDDDEEDF
eukprot:CAMPEP_0206146518 /NCGR_PEP_ID=MMETSP1473-20131121/30561_1 /ASSEMBLY_ACC=CAM_ASM_001109 /TAXON_ID=1461547 /ORGANISM="Stichococcus sp, Strain RCC1054" /LENGTH=403 /DNA_ID=CAMNT_0053543101 /DNA_START=287 /DNA_END=1498 /DNA_ORIENTATION=-